MTKSRISSSRESRCFNVIHKEIRKHNMNAKRYHTLDFIRGINLISMILFHACWDLEYMFDIRVPGYTGTFGSIWQKCICITFIIISGMCSSFGTNMKNKIKRGVIILICGYIVSTVVFIFTPESPIHFGILTFMGFAMILFALLEPVLKKINPYEMAVVGLTLYYMLRHASRRVLDIFFGGPVLLPKAMYKNMFTAFLGFPPSGFISSDYFPVVPWIFMYAVGFALGIILKKKGVLDKLKKPEKTIFNNIGKHTLIIYMLHQPIIYGVLWLILGNK